MTSWKECWLAVYAIIIFNIKETVGVETSPPRQQENGHSCLYNFMTRDEYVSCQNRSLTDLSGCGTRKCVGDENFCLAIYNDNNGRWLPNLLNCHQEYYGHKHCSNGTCVLRALGNKHPGYYKCCCYGAMCNSNLILPVLKETTVRNGMGKGHEEPTAFLSNQNTPQEKNTISYLLPSTIIPFIVMLVAAITYYLKKRTRLVYSQEPLLTISSSIVQGHSIKLDLQETIHSGKLGLVKKSLYNYKPAAVKIFNSDSKAEWEKEKQIYEFCSTGHESLLKFLGSDLMYESGVPQYVIITEYHSNGSLADYLRNYTVDLTVLLNFLYGMSSALNYLHAGDSTSPSRPTIAHRDIKSSNILVKDDLTCCIGDFGLALPIRDQTEMFTSPDFCQVGTNRYMAPEMLEGNITFCWDSLLQIDIYSFSLVVWEVLTRFQHKTVDASVYTSPFYEQVGQHPSIRDMIQCVCKEKTRPFVKKEWLSHPILKTVCDTMMECWDEEAYARLTAGCVHERILQLKDEVVNHTDQSDSESLLEETKYVDLTDCSSSCSSQSPTPPLIVTPAKY